MIEEEEGDLPPPLVYEFEEDAAWEAANPPAPRTYEEYLASRTYEEYPGEGAEPRQQPSEGSVPAKKEVTASKRSAAHHPNKDRGGGAYEAVRSESSSWFGAWPRLLTYKVITKSCSQYLNCVFDFLRFVKNDEHTRKLNLDFTSWKDLGVAATWWMEKRCYQDLRSAQDGKNLRSGLLHLVPEQKGQLPMSS